jgi:hypothetical protein
MSLTDIEELVSDINQISNLRSHSKIINFKGVMRTKIGF